MSRAEGSPARAHTASARLALHHAGEDALTERTARATADPGSPLFGASNTAVVLRAGALRRRDERVCNQEDLC